MVGVWTRGTGQPPFAVDYFITLFNVVGNGVVKSGLQERWAAGGLFAHDFIEPTSALEFVVHLPIFSLSLHLVHCLSNCVTSSQQFQGLC